jgi:ATP-dependent HslUV protease subunit HslV
MNFNNDSSIVRSTTILCVKRFDVIVMAADGQVSLGDTIVKGTAQKIKSLANGKVLVGFAGSVGDCLTLVDRLEEKIEKFKDLKRACYELARDWRLDKYIKELEARIIVADKDNLLVLTGNGNILDPEDNIASVGSGSLYALSAAKALYNNTNMTAKEIAEVSMKVAADTCVYTNHNILMKFIG